MFKAAVLAVVAAEGVNGAKYECYTGPLTVGKNEVQMSTVVDSIKNMFFQKAGEVIAANPDFKEFMLKRGQCQLACLDNTVQQSLKVLYGKCANNLETSACKGLAVESLTGAFMACVPRAPREAVYPVIRNVVLHQMHDLSDMMNDHPVGSKFTQALGGLPQCAKQADINGFNVMEFQNDLEAISQSLAHEDPQVMHLMVDYALGCQMSCLGTTLTESVKVLIGTGLIEKKFERSQGLTGAARTCFPGLPRHMLKEMTTRLADAYIAKHEPQLLPPGASTPAPLATLAPTPAPIQPAVSPAPIQPAATPAATHPAATPAATHPAATPAATHPAATHPAATPAATHPAAKPAATHPAATPAHTQPAATPAATHPAATPAHTQPAAAPAHTQPAATQPAATPAATHPAATPAHTKPAATPAHTQPAAKPQWQTQKPTEAASASAPANKPAPAPDTRLYDTAYEAESTKASSMSMGYGGAAMFLVGFLGGVAMIHRGTRRSQTRTFQAGIFEEALAEEGEMSDVSLLAH